jgi:hypothetical protein
VPGAYRAGGNVPPPAMTAAATLCLGLHVTKCAGTSLITTLRRVLTEDEYYFFSSYHESWLASRPRFAEIVDRDRLRIVFGHYCHETLLSVFAHRKIFFFTGLREPVACVISGYRQVNAVRAQSGRSPLPARDYLETYANPMCNEVLRCFPTLADGPGALWERARAALSLFDFIYETETFSSDVETLIAVLDIPTVKIESDNLSDQRAVAPDVARFISAGCEEIRASARTFIADDLRLYAAMRPHMGRPWMRRELQPASWVLDRADYTAALPKSAEALARFCDRERDFTAHEFEELGAIAALRASLQARIRLASDMLERLGPGLA